MRSIGTGRILRGKNNHSFAAVFHINDTSSCVSSLSGTSPPPQDPTTDSQTPPETTDCAKHGLLVNCTKRTPFSSNRRENVKENHGEKAPRIDQPVAALLKDLKRRGMLDDTLVLFTTEYICSSAAVGASFSIYHLNRTSFRRRSSLSWVPCLRLRPSSQVRSGAARSARSWSARRASRPCRRGSES